MKRVIRIGLVAALAMAISGCFPSSCSSQQSQAVRSYNAPQLQQGPGPSNYNGYQPTNTVVEHHTEYVHTQPQPAVNHTTVVNNRTTVIQQPQKTNQQLSKQPPAGSTTTPVRQVTTPVSQPVQRIAPPVSLPVQQIRSNPAPAPVSQPVRSYSAPTSSYSAPSRSYSSSSSSSSRR